MSAPFHEAQILRARVNHQHLMKTTHHVQRQAGHQKVESMTTAIIGRGNVGSAVARNLVAGGERVVLAARDDSHAAALAKELGPLASSASVSQAIADADTVVLAVWLDTLTALVPENYEKLAFHGGR